MDSSVYDIDEDRPRSRHISSVTRAERATQDHEAHTKSNAESSAPLDETYLANEHSSQSSFPSDLVPGDSPFFQQATKPLTKQWTANAVEVVKLGNVVVAVIGCIYFFLHGYYDVVLEYDQIVFLSILVNILDSKPGKMRVLWFFLIVCSGISWTLMAVYLGAWNLPVYHSIAWTIMAFFYDSGTIACAYVILQHPSNKLKTTNFLEVDLLLYLTTLNAICIFPVEHVNNSLHMILDIRMIVLLYGGLYRPNDKVALLRRKSFWFIMFCVLAFFILDSNGNPYCQLASSFANMGVGAVLLSEAALFHYVKYPRIRKMQEESSSDEASSSAVDGDMKIASTNDGVPIKKIDFNRSGEDDDDVRGSSLAMSRLSQVNRETKDSSTMNPMVHAK